MSCLPQPFFSIFRPNEMTESIVIKERLNNTFSAFSYTINEEYIYIYHPAPSLFSVMKHHKTKTELYERHFMHLRYEKIDCLTGCGTTFIFGFFKFF